MLFKSPVIAEGSGSIAGLTFSRNRGGAYIRSRVTPVNPATASQVLVRTHLATLTARWSGVLTQVQRDAWDLYALNVPLPGPLGEPRNVGGLGMYIRTNVPAGIVGRDPVDDAPTIFDLGTFTPVVSPTAAAATNEFSFLVNPSDDWATEDVAALIGYISRPNNPGINYFTGPYRLAGAVAGEDPGPITSAQTLTSAFPFVADQKIFCRVAVLRADGRYSTDQRLEAVAT